MQRQLLICLEKMKLGNKQYKRTNGEEIRTRLPQAFFTAGKVFEVISNDYKIGGCWFHIMMRQKN